MPYLAPPPDRRCQATSKRSGEQCGKWAIKGLTVCRMHGGGTQRAKAAAARNVQLATAQAAVVTYGLDEDVDPLDALEAELRRTAGAVAYLQGLVQTLDAPGLGQSTRASGRVPSVWVELYQRERKHLTEVAATCLRVGLEERRVALAEQTGAIVADLLRKVVVDLGHDPADENVRGIVRRHLLAVS